jgi:hypothetical protein
MICVEERGDSLQSCLDLHIGYFLSLMVESGGKSYSFYLTQGGCPTRRRFQKSGEKDWWERGYRKSVLSSTAGVE